MVTIVTPYFVYEIRIILQHLLSSIMLSSMLSSIMTLRREGGYFKPPFFLFSPGSINQLKKPPVGYTQFSIAQ